MICDLCNKNNAVIHIEKHSGDNHTQFKICCECAGLEGLSPENLTSENLQKLISEINGQIQETKTATCLECGMDSEVFKNSGRLGCSSCYTYLKSSFDMSMWQKTPHFKHIGKTPYQFEISPEDLSLKTEDLQTLEDRLIICISQENYEEAAILRDRIEEMKKAIL